MLIFFILIYSSEGLLLEDDWLHQLGIFENKTNVTVIQLLLNYELISLSEIRKKLREIYKLEITLPGLLKHLRDLEEAGIVRQDPETAIMRGDLRKNIYILQGKERVRDILQSWNVLSQKMVAGQTFCDLVKVCRRVFISEVFPIQTNNRLIVEKLLARCESADVFGHLTEDEKMKIKFWKLMLTSTRGASK